jgi:hypothetical protein
VPELPALDPGTVVPEVTTLPVPVEELDGVTQPVTDAVDAVTGGIGEVVDEVTGGVGETVDGVVDEVTGGGGTVGGVVDEVTGGGGVGGVVDDVTDGVTGPVEEALDTVNGAVDEVGGQLGNTAGEVAGRVGDAVDGLTGNGSVAPGAEPNVPGETGTTIAGGGRTPGTRDDVAGLRTALDAAAAVSPDGFYGSGAAAALPVPTVAGSPTDAGTPSLVERIARSAADVAERIAFPLLLAFLVGGFVLVQNRLDRKDPKLALAALDAEEDLLGFE